MLVAFVASNNSLLCHASSPKLWVVCVKKKSKLHPGFSTCTMLLSVQISEKSCSTLFFLVMMVLVVVALIVVLVMMVVVAIIVVLVMMVVVAMIVVVLVLVMMVVAAMNDNGSGCSYDSGNGYDCAGGCFFFSLIHMFT